MSPILQVFLSLFSAVALSIAIPNEFFNLGCPLVSLIALVPLYLAVAGARSYKAAFWLCWLHGGLTHLLSSFWLKNFQGMALFTLGASLAGTAFIEAFVGLILYYPFSKKQNQFSPLSVLIRIFWFPSVYVLYEWCKSTGFLAYPWGTLSMTAVSWPVFMQIADITSQYGVSFLFALFSSLTAQSILTIFSGENHVSKTICFHALHLAARTTCALFTVTLLYGTFQYTRPRKPVKYINTVMVQQNEDTFRANELEYIKASETLTDRGLEEFKEKGLKTDLIVWSEGVLNRRWPDSKSFYTSLPDERPLLNFIASKKTPFIIGGALILDKEKHKYSNAALLFDQKGQYAGAYSKLHLVPFAEAIPFVDYEPVRKFIKKIAGFSYGWTAGAKNTVFEVPVSTPPENNSAEEVISLVKDRKPQKTPSVMVAAPICFDDAYGHVFRGLFRAGTELFMNITNDSWSKTRSAEYQHYAVAACRAIEFRTTLARCTNSGYTVVLNPAGKIVDSLPLFEKMHLSLSIPVYERKLTVAAKYADWLPYSLMIFALIYILYDTKTEQSFERTQIETSLVRRRRTRKS